MQSSLRAAMGQFRGDFDRELARAYLNFQSDRAASRDEIERHLAVRYGEWADRAPFPRLVSGLYFVEERTEKDETLAQFDPATARFAPAPWPSELSAWRERRRSNKPNFPSHLRLIIDDLAKHSQAGPGSAKVDKQLIRQRSTETKRDPADQVLSAFRQSSTFNGVMAERIIDDVPALIIPLFSPPLDESLSRPISARTIGYAIVKFDIAYLRNEFIPNLAGRYFGTAQGLDYRLTITSRRDPSRIIYPWPEKSMEKAAEPAPNEKARTSDGETGLFAVRVEDFGGLLSEQSSEKNRVFSIGAVRSDRFTYRVIAGSGATPSPDPILMDVDGHWQLRLTHRAGSLEAAVASVRRRTLAISFGILLLLAASIAMLLISTRRAQRLAAQQMEFVAGVSHELRTPLAVIRSAADNLAGGYVSAPDQVQRYGTVIRSEGRRLSEMVEQVLEVAGAQSGRRNYLLRPSTVGQVIEDAVTASHLALVEGGFELSEEIEANLPLIRADLTALSRALQNLISNAIKYSGESRWIGLRARRGNGQRGIEVQITVTDRGLGIPEEDLPHIGEPFFRGRDVLDAQIRGSGLGLSLVRHIVEAHDGRLTIESSRGRGSAFTLHIPAASCEEQGATSTESSYGQAHLAG
jgi:signal transduction histidine kinase